MSGDKQGTVEAIQRCLEALSLEASEAGYTMLAHIISFAANCAREEARTPAPPPPRRVGRLKLILGGRT